VKFSVFKQLKILRFKKLCLNIPFNHQGAFMKKLVTLIFVIFPLISFANCLEINGSYTCSYPQGSYQLKVSTNFIDGVPTYELLEENEMPEVFIADGKDRPFEEVVEEGILVKGNNTNICDVDFLAVHHTGKIQGHKDLIELKTTAKVSEGILYFRHLKLVNSRIVEKTIEKCTLN